MPVKLTYLEARPPGRPPAPGEVWPLAEGEPFPWSSQQYNAAWRTGENARRPLYLKLPDETEYSLDGAINGSGLHMEGVPPNLTANTWLAGRSGQRWRLVGGALYAENEQPPGEHQP